MLLIKNQWNAKEYVYTCVHNLKLSGFDLKLNFKL